MSIDQPITNSSITSGPTNFRSLVGSSEVMQSVRKIMEQVAKNKVTVLILGESGTGKEILARNLHYRSDRRELPFHKINCLAYSPERFELELFGVEAGHHGAQKSHAGLIEKANRGTIFFDEVGDLPMEIQGKLMSFLENKNVKRVGGSESLPVDARVIVSTNQNLEEKIAKGKFREDLFYRLSIVPIKMPALRDHTEDIPELVNELVVHLESCQGKRIRFNATALLSFQRHNWPGNVRELTNLVERLSITQGNDVLGLSDLPLEYQHMDSNELERMENKTENGADFEASSTEQEEGSLVMQDFASLNQENLVVYLSNFEKHLIHTALKDSEGAFSFAANRLSLSEDELAVKMKQHELK